MALLFTLFVALHVADGVTTYIALRDIPTASEGNKAMAWVMARLGLAGTLAAGISVMLGIGVFSWLVIGWPYGAIPLVLLGAREVYVVHNNLRVLAKHRS